MSVPVNLFGRLLKMAHFLGTMPKEEYLEPGAKLIRVLYGFHQVWALVFLIPVFLSQVAALYRYWGDNVLVLDIVCMMTAIGMGIWGNVWSLVMWKRFLKALTYMQTKSILTTPLVHQNFKLRQILDKGRRRSNLFSRAIGCSITLAILFWITTPFIIRYLQRKEQFCTDAASNRSLTPRELYHQDGYDQFSFPMWLPLNSTEWYTEIWIWQMLSYLGAYRAMVPCSTLMMGIYLATATQFEIIAALVDMVSDYHEEDDHNALVPITEIQLGDDQIIEENFSTSMMAKKFLKEVVKLHQEVLVASEEMGSLQSPAVGITLGFLMLLIVSSMFQLTVDPALSLKYGLTLAACFFHIYIYTYFGEYITEQSAKIGTAAYESNWYDRSTEFKRLIYLMIIRCQRPCVWTLLKIADVKLLTFADVTSTCYRILMLLLQVEDTNAATGGTCVE